MPIAATSYKQALDDLLYLTHPKSHVWGASILTTSILGLIKHNIEILSLSSIRHAEPLSMDDILQLSLIRSRLRSRKIPVDRLDEILEQNVYRTLEEMEECKARRTVRQLDAVLRLRERSVRDESFGARALDETIEIIVGKMWEDVEEVVTVS